MSFLYHVPCSSWRYLEGLVDLSLNFCPFQYQVDRHLTVYSFSRLLSATSVEFFPRSHSEN